jgi:hypothetical protein
VARDAYTITVDIEVEGPEYDFNRYDKDNDYRIKKAKAVAVGNTIVGYVQSWSDAVKGTGITSVRLNSAETNTQLTDEERGIELEISRKEEEAWDNFQNAIDARMRDDLALGIYSMGDLYGCPSQLDEVVHNGPARIVIADGWGDEEPVYSSIVNNPTNWNMFELFCEALQKSNDHHHVFLEDIELISEQNGVAVYRALTGS